MGNYYNPVNILIDRIDVIESVLNNLNPQVKNIVLLLGEEISHNHNPGRRSPNVSKSLKC